VISCGSRQHIHSNKHEQQTTAENCASACFVSKPITSARQASCGAKKAVQSHLYSSLRKRSAFKSNLMRRTCVAPSHRFTNVCAAQGSVSESKRDRLYADVAKLRHGLQNPSGDAFLPNYWANCLLIRQRLLVLCIAEAWLSGAQCDRNAHVE
jgi:hypothetical protein